MKMYNVVSELEKGDLVRFSGYFFSDKEDCIYESSFTLQGGLEEPEFKFKFTNIEKLEINGQLQKDGDIKLEDVINFKSK